MHMVVETGKSYTNEWNDWGRVSCVCVASEESLNRATHDLSCTHASSNVSYRSVTLSPPDMLDSLLGLGQCFCTFDKAANTLIAHWNPMQGQRGNGWVPDDTDARIMGVYCSQCTPSKLWTC